MSEENHDEDDDYCDDCGNPLCPCYDHSDCK